MSPQVVAPSSIVAPQRQQPPETLGASMAGVFGEFVRGTGKVIGSFRQDPVGTTLKIGLGITLLAMAAPYVVAGAVGLGVLNHMSRRGGYGPGPVY